MKDKLRSSVRGASKGEGIPQEILNYTGSVIDPQESPDEISNKIGKMLPDMKIIRDTGIIKNTESFKESKQILTNFREGLAKSPEGTFDQHKQDYSFEVSDGKPALERTVESLERVVINMLRAGIQVPQIYKDFLHTVKPPTPEKDVEILEKPPLFKITGLDENGEVKVETDTPLVLKKGKTAINLTHEKLSETLLNSKKVDCKMVQDMRNWVKYNLNQHGSLEKVSEDEWNKLRKTIVDRFNEQAKVAKDVQDIVDEQGVTSDEIDEIIDELENEVSSPEPTETKVKIEVPPSVNKNAYEIRLQVLQEALEWVKHNKNTNRTEDVMDVANKFYKFVEQRR